jgi:hypothetical protein
VPFGVGDTQLLIRTIRELASRRFLHAFTQQFWNGCSRNIYRYHTSRPRPQTWTVGAASLDSRNFAAVLKDRASRSAMPIHGASDVFCVRGPERNDNDLHFGLDVLHPERRSRGGKTLPEGR